MTGSEFQVYDPTITARQPKEDLSSQSQSSANIGQSTVSLQEGFYDWLDEEEAEAESSFLNNRVIEEAEEPVEFRLFYQSKEYELFNQLVDFSRQPINFCSGRASTSLSPQRERDEIEDALSQARRLMEG